MANPRTPHIIGVSLDAQGVAKTKVIVTNFTSGGIQIANTDANKRAVIDCADFTSGYSNGDVIGLENAGASFGGGTVTVDTAKGMQTLEIDATAASTTAHLSM